MTTPPGAPVAPVDEEMIARLTHALELRSEILFAVLFGSTATGRAHPESDVDIAVYIDDREPAVSVERPGTFASEEELWSEMETITGRAVDLIVLNRAPATVGGGAILTGRPLMIRNRRLYTDYLLLATGLAEDERTFITDFVAIKHRSRSLSDVDRARLVRILDFIEDELEDTGDFAEVSLARYTTDRTFRRSIERWIENLVNASVDMAKIILGSERRPIPQTYRETIDHLSTVPAFAHHAALCSRLAVNTRVRNMLAHEYLDLRFARISAVAAEATDYAELATLVRAWMAGESRHID